MMTGLEMFIEILKAKKDDRKREFESLVINATEEQMAEIVKICDLTSGYFKDQQETRRKFNELTNKLNR